MVAERRDLMVETYSSYCGTGAAAMVSVCTGIACGAACGGPCLAQAVRAKRASGRHCLVQTGNLIKTGSSDEKLAAETPAFLCLQLDTLLHFHSPTEERVYLNGDSWMWLPQRLLQKFY